MFALKCISVVKWSSFNLSKYVIFATEPTKINARGQISTLKNDQKWDLFRLFRRQCSALAATSGREGGRVIDGVDRDRVGVLIVVLVAIQIHVVGYSSINKLVLALKLRQNGE